MLSETVRGSVIAALVMVGTIAVALALFSLTRPAAVSRSKPVPDTVSLELRGTR